MAESTPKDASIEIPDSGETTTASNMTEQQQQSTAMSSVKCRSCLKRTALKLCIQHYCSQCCTASTCIRHVRLRQHAQWKQSVLSGTTPVQIMAAELRKRAVKPKRFTETGFVHTGDSVVIWDLREFIKNQKWKEDAVRKSIRRSAREQDAMPASMFITQTKSRRKRFRVVLDKLYNESVHNSS